MAFVPLVCMASSPTASWVDGATVLASYAVPRLPRGMVPFIAGGVLRYAVYGVGGGAMATKAILITIFIATVHGATDHERRIFGVPLARKVDVDAATASAHGMGRLV